MSDEEGALPATSNQTRFLLFYHSSILFLALFFLMFIPVTCAEISFYPIAYTTPTITLTDGVYSFTDIYDADIANGWGVVFDNNGTQYIFTARLIIYDNATLIKPDKQVIFIDALTEHINQDTSLPPFSEPVKYTAVEETALNDTNTENTPVLLPIIVTIIATWYILVFRKQE